MSDFLRPEAIQALKRWREAILGAALVGLGAFWALTTFGTLRVVGLFLILAGVPLIVEGIRRARWKAQSAGVGVVELDERLLSYLTAEGGGAVSLDEVERVTVLTSDAGPVAPDLFWLFETPEGPLMIPGNANGSEAIFDALAALPGADYSAALAAAGSVENARFVIWQSDGARDRTPTLHT